MPRKRQDTLTRAERIRQRRQQQAAQAKPARKPRRRQPKPAAATATANTTPVVVSRYGVVGEAVAQPAGRVRRQVRVARGKHTALVTSVPWVSLGWRWVSLGLSLFLFAVLLALWYAPIFRVDVPEIRGVHYLDAGRVADALPVRQKPIFALSPQELADTLTRFPAIKHATVTVAFPNRVVVTVEERQPVLVWQSTRRNWWVDADGVAYAPMAEEAPAGTLVVKASEMPFDAAELQPGLLQLLSPAQVAALQTLSRYVPEGTPLVYHPRYGVGWQAEEGWHVYVGQELSQMEQRMALYQAIAAWLKAQDIHPALVSVASLKAPYYRMEP